MQIALYSKVWQLSEIYFLRRITELFNKCRGEHIVKLFASSTEQWLFTTFGI